MFEVEYGVSLFSVCKGKHHIHASRVLPVGHGTVLGAGDRQVGGGVRVGLGGFLVELHA